MFRSLVRSARGRRVLIVSATAASVALLASGCSGSATKSTSSTGGTLTIGVHAAPSLNPAKGASSGDSAPIRLAYDALIRWNSDGSFSPDLATKWGYTDKTNQHYQLTIRSGVKFSDGDKLDAQAVANSINYVKTAMGPAAGSVAGLTAAASGADTVDITATTPNPDITKLLTNYFLIGCIISPTGLKNPKALETESHGVGPYEFSKIATGTEYVLKANPTYFDKSRIHYSTIDFKTFMNDNSATQAVISGQIAMWGTGASASIVSAGKASHLTVTPGNLTWDGLQLLDPQGKVQPALKDVRVRQAISYALDRAAITKAVYGDAGTPRVQPANDNWLGFDPALEKLYPYDPAKAKQLLAAAGYAKGFTVSATYFAGTSSEQLFQAAAGYLAKVGITLKLDGGTTIAAVIGKLSGGQDAIADLPNDGISVYSMVVRNNLEHSNTNGLNEVDPGLVTRFDAASKSQGAAAWTEVLRYMTEDALTIPISQNEGIYLSNSSIDVSKAANKANGQLDVSAITPAG